MREPEAKAPPIVAAQAADDATDSGPRTGPIPFEIEGAGPTVLLLHGCPAPARSLDPLRHHLARTHRVVVPELSGIGVGFDAALERLVAALLARGIDEVAVVGHSGGAYRAFQLALDGRIKVRSVVALGPLACVVPPQLEQFAALADAVEAGAVDLPELTWQLWFTEDFRRAQPEMRAELDAWFAQLGNATLLGLRHECEGGDLRPALATLDIPVYLRVGALDVSTPAAEAEALALLIPGAHLDVVPGCAHFLHFEDGPNTLEAVRRFLDP